VLYQLSYSHRFVTIIATGMGAVRRGNCADEFKTDLMAAHADVLESHGAQADGVEKILGVHDHRAF
jgi:hypothetical protein